MLTFKARSLMRTRDHHLLPRVMQPLGASLPTPSETLDRIRLLGLNTSKQEVLLRNIAPLYRGNPGSTALQPSIGH